MLHRLVFHLLVAVEGEVVVVAGDLGLGYQEAAVGALAPGLVLAPGSVGLPASEDVGQVALVRLRGALVVQRVAVALPVVEPDLVGGAGPQAVPDAVDLGFEFTGNQAFSVPKSSTLTKTPTAKPTNLRPNAETSDASVASRPIGSAPADYALAMTQVIKGPSKDDRPPREHAVGLRAGPDRT